VVRDERSDPVQFRILGPLEAENQSGPVPLRGNGQRVILSALLTTPNDVVPVDVLVDWLWPRRPPRTAPSVIQAHMSRLRRAFEPHRPARAPDGLLTRLGRGYLLRIDPDQLDAVRFERLVDAGRAALERSQPGPAATLLSDALALWRGAVLSDVTLANAARHVVVRLEALRQAATALRFDAELRLGRHLPILPELQSLVHAHPLDERLSGQLMLALYRSGQPAAALAAYDRIRCALRADLGIAPLPALQSLRAAILAHRHDVELPHVW
jgi:DNA-binding SARP family transcriptional activator